MSEEIQTLKRRLKRRLLETGLSVTSAIVLTSSPAGAFRGPRSWFAGSSRRLRMTNRPTIEGGETR